MANGAAILGVRIDGLPQADVIRLILTAVEQNRRMIITYANIHAVNLAFEQPWFRDILNRSDLVFCDGFGVKLGARLLGQHLPERFTPPDWIDVLAALSASHRVRLFLLGARPGVAELAAARLRDSYPGVQIVGTHDGYFDKRAGSAQNESIITAINAAQPQIILVGFGMPMQELWLKENWDRLEVNVVLTVGALFDYVSGTVARGPRWMTDHGLEWLARLIIEPRRLWRRYLIGNPLFLWRVFKQRMGWWRPET